MEIPCSVKVAQKKEATISEVFPKIITEAPKADDELISDSGSDSYASQMDIMNNQLDDGYISPLELKENYTGKLNFAILDDVIKPKPKTQSYCESTQKLSYNKGKMKMKNILSINDIPEDSDDSNNRFNSLVNRKRSTISKGKMLLSAATRPSQSQNASRLQMSINKNEKDLHKKATEEIINTSFKSKPKKAVKEVKRIQKQAKKLLSEASSFANSDDDDYGFDDDDIPQDKQSRKKFKKGLV